MGSFNTVQESGGGGGDLSFDGDTFGEDKTIGSSDNYALSVETNNTERLKFTNDGRGLSSFTCSGWVHFDGTDVGLGNPCTIADSHNVSSVTDAGNAPGGYYIVNWDVDLADANYCITGCTNDINWGGNVCVYHEDAAHMTTALVGLRVGGIKVETQAEPNRVMVTAFGGN